MSTEKVTVKVELDRDDVLMFVKLSGHTLTDEMWDAMKNRECTMVDGNMGDQAMAIRLCFAGVAVTHLLEEKK